jgi:hypothetical protein
MGEQLQQGDRFSSMTLKLADGGNKNRGQAKHRARRPSPRVISY